MLRQVERQRQILDQQAFLIDAGKDINIKSILPTSDVKIKDKGERICIMKHAKIVYKGEKDGKSC